MSSVLTQVSQRFSAALVDAIRVATWSAGGRLLAVCADGRAMVDHRGQLTAPLAHDPVAAAWLDERRVGVVESGAALVISGSGTIRDVAVPDAALVGTSGGRTVVGGNGVIAVIGHPDLDTDPAIIETGTGPTSSLTHVQGALWVVGGAEGLAIVDVALGCIDTRVDINGVQAVACDDRTIVAADLAGAVHVMALSEPDRGIELTGYRDPVRHLALTTTGVVAAADDELTIWTVDRAGRTADEPVCAVAHDQPITALAARADGMLASGDAAGVVRFWSPALIDHPVGEATLDGEVTIIDWARHGDLVACGTVTGQVAVYAVERGSLA